MSTTVTYKGSTLTTVNNQTRTLKTAGKYMEGDVILVDVTESGSGSGVVWQTLYDGSVEVYSSTPNYFQISPYTTAFQSDQTYRVTWGQTQYLCNTITDPLGATYDGWLIGNLSIVGAGADTGEPFLIYRNSATGLTGGTTSSAGTASLKIELQQGGANLQNKTVTPTTSQQTVQADSGYDGLGTVTVNAMPSGTAGTPTATKGTVSNHSISVTPSVTNTAGYISGGAINGTAVTVTASELVSGNKAISANGTDIDVTNYATVSVAVGSGVNNQNKTVTPTESQQSITADSGYSGLGTVTVNAISSTYIGSSINQLDSSDLTASGATVTAPAGYYAEAASKSVSSMTLPTSAASSATSGYTSKATIGRSTAAQYINIPPGYNSTGAYYVISAVANGSATAPASISGTAASVSTGTNTLTLTKTVSVTPTVSAGYVSAGTAGNSSISLTASVTTKAAATITPTTTNQTIAAGTYLTGAQTIAGDADLVGGNILSTANIFGVQGTVVIQNYYTGSSAPSSSTGSNGDLYLQS